MSWLRCGGLFASLLVLSACSVLPREQASHSAAQQSEMRRASVQQWVLKARLVTADQRASLRWRQQRDEFDLLLRGPFGFGGVRIPVWWGRWRLLAGGCAACPRPVSRPSSVVMWSGI